MRACVRTIRGLSSIVVYVLNTVFWCTPLFLVALAKSLVPVRGFRNRCTRLLNAIAGGWVATNTLNQRLFAKTSLQVQGTPGCSLENNYLILANHQSWVDILVLQRIFHRRIPFLKFFIKKELRWFPLLGQAWWALDFPFMKRYSQKVLVKKPHLKGRDLEITRKACKKFKTTPVAIMNFVEGTRYSRRKHRQQNAPYRHLLKSKAGGIAYVLAAMGDQLHAILDVTIVYPQNVKSFWSFVCGEIREIKVRVRAVPVTPNLLGDYAGDGSFREQFQVWLNNLWAEKDRRMQEMQAPIRCD